LMCAHARINLFTRNRISEAFIMNFIVAECQELSRELYAEGSRALEVEEMRNRAHTPRSFC